MQSPGACHYVSGFRAHKIDGVVLGGREWSALLFSGKLTSLCVHSDLDPKRSCTETGSQVTETNRLMVSHIGFSGYYYCQSTRAP